MSFFSASYTSVADAAAASQSLTSFIHPAVSIFCVIAGLVTTGFLVAGGIQMMSSKGEPEKLIRAKHTVWNALLGLVVVLGAVTLTGVLTNTYTGTKATTSSSIPTLPEVTPQTPSGGLVDVLIDSIAGLLHSIIDSIAMPFLHALDFFTQATPLMSTNASVFNLWLTVTALANVLFVLVVILLGFHIMSASTLGIDELEFKHLIPQLLVIFIFMNSSLVMIDSIIALSNAMIHALQAGFPVANIWGALTDILGNTGGTNLATLLIIIVFLILAVILLVYYILRLVVLYIGAVLAPLVILLWLLPSFKDFAHHALRTYLTVIFVLFIHTVILALAASLFLAIGSGSGKGLDPIMSLLVGIATLFALLKTQHMMNSMSLTSAGARSTRKLGGQFVNGISAMSGYIAGSRKAGVKHPPKPQVTVRKVITE